jgi:hypothetical protein
MTFTLKGQEIGITISERFVLTHQCLGMMSMLANALMRRDSIRQTESNLGGCSSKTSWSGI